MHKEAEAQHCTRQRFPPNHSCITQWVITTVHSSQHTSQLPTSLPWFSPSSHLQYGVSHGPGWAGFPYSDPFRRRQELRATCLKIPSRPAFVFEEVEWLVDPPGGQRSRSSRGRSAGVKAGGVPTSIECLSICTVRADGKQRGNRAGMFDWGEMHRQSLCWQTPLIF